MTKPITLKDYYAEARIYQQRSAAAVLGVLLLALVLVARLFFLQVVQYDLHVTQSDRNRIQVQPMPPTRGLIYDRNQNLLA